jgi:hypothetical protein
MTIGYSVPGDDFEREELEFVFSYDANPTAATSSATTAGDGVVTGTFHTSPDGFRIQVPNGWVIWDGDNTMPAMQELEQESGIAMLAELCPQTGAVPQIGGEYVCSPSEDAPRVSIFTYANLTSIPEFAPVVSQGQNITVSDYAAFWIQQSTQGQSFVEYEVVESEERTVNAFDVATNTTLEGITVPAQWMSINVGEETQGFRTTQVIYNALLVLSLDGNTGYTIIPTGRYSEDGGRPPESEEILDSFEVVVPSSISTTTPSTVSPPQQEQEQQPPSPPAPQLVL